VAAGCSSFFFFWLATSLGVTECYPYAPVLHESACRVLVGDAEHQDGAIYPGSILHSAPSLAFYATKLVTGMVQNCPNPKYNPLKLANAAAELLGHVLGAVEPGTFLPAQQAKRTENELGVHTDEHSSDPSGPVLEDGLVALAGLLRQFPNSAPLAAQVCRALVRIRVVWATQKAAGRDEALLSILASYNVGDALLKVAQRFPENADVINEATLAVGVLGGFGQVVELMRARPGCLVAQQAGCRAISEMCRLGAAAAGQEAVGLARAAVLHAQSSFHGQFGASSLQTRAEVALGLLGSVAEASLAGQGATF